MTLQRDRQQEFVSLERGEINRQIFSDPEIFEQELELIFGRAWNFLGHESQIPKTGDFFEVPIGRDNVLIVRQRDGSIKALLNTCTHRGNAVCRAEEGNTKNFMCTYHGWTFALDGELIGVPGFENLYHSDLDKSSLGLREVAQLDIYHGFIFGTLDASAPPLLDFLGTSGRLGLDLLYSRGDMKVAPGIQKYVINCNWKFAVDNLFDWHHAAITHMSANGLLFAPPPGVEAPPVDPTKVIDRGGALKDDGSVLNVPVGLTGPRNSLDSIAVLGEYGHAIGGPEYNEATAITRPGFNNEWRKSPETLERLGPVGVRVAGHPNIFPNTWITGSQLCLRVPISPDSTEIWWFTFVDQNTTEEEQKAAVNRIIHVFGPAGFLEQEDGENWAQSTMQTTGLVSRKIPQMLKMDLGRGKVQHQGGLSWVESPTSEHAQLWTYHSWAQYMSGVDWETLKSRTTPGDRI